MSEIQELTEFLKLLSAETDRKFKEIAEEQRIRSAELDRKFAETDRELKELGRETDRRIRELTKNVGGISDSNGHSAEQFFSSALAHSRSLNGMNFEAFAPNVSLVRTVNNVEVHDEFDVVLYRADAVALVEIKYRLRKDDVEYLARKKVENYRLLFSNEVSGKAIYLAAAGLSVDRGVVEVAKKLGVYILTQKGEGIQILNDVAKAY